MLATSALVRVKQFDTLWTTDSNWVTFCIHSTICSDYRPFLDSDHYQSLLRWLQVWITAPFTIMLPWIYIYIYIMNIYIYIHNAYIYIHNAYIYIYIMHTYIYIHNAYIYIYNEYIYIYNAYIYLYIHNMHIYITNTYIYIYIYIYIHTWYTVNQHNLLQVVGQAKERGVPFPQLVETAENQRHGEWGNQ